MLLYFPEYSKYSSKTENYSKLLFHYYKLPKYLHEMEATEIITEMNRNGSKTFYQQKAAIINYLSWLSKNYNVDVNELYYKLQTNDNKKSLTYVGFFDFDDLNKSIQEAIMTVETNTNSEYDFDGLYMVFYLEWLCVHPKDIISIRLEDVTDMGDKIYIPSEDRTLTVDNETIKDYIWTYKNKIGSRKSPTQKDLILYTQNTLYRTISGKDVTEKTIYNARTTFLKITQDKRFKQNIISDSRRYYEIYQAEIASNCEFSLIESDEATKDFIKQTLYRIYNKKLSISRTTEVLRNYSVYKKEYLERLKTK